MSLGSERFAQHYTKYIDEMYQYVFFAVRQHAPTAEDLTSDIFLKAWKHAKRFDPEKASFRTFIFRIARTSVIDYWRTHKESHSLDSAIDHETAQNGMQQHINRIQQQADATLFWQLAQQHVEQDAYEILVLKYRNDFSIAEIAIITDRSEDSVKSLLKRSRAVLKNFLTNQPL